MHAPDGLSPSATRPPAPAVRRHELNEAELFYVDVRAGSLIVGEYRRRALERVFGIPADEQSLLVTLALLGAVVAVAHEYLSELPRPGRPDGYDTAVGASVVDAAMRGIAGPQADEIPLAGVLICSALLLQGLRPTVTATVQAARSTTRSATQFLRDAHRAFTGRYAPASG